MDQKTRNCLASRIMTRQGNQWVGDRMYGFVGRDRLLNAAKVYTGRVFPRWGLKASPLGNPYRVNQLTEAEHRKAVVAYRQWFDAQMRRGNQSAVFREVDRLANKLLNEERIILTCFCPTHLPCHARDVVQPAILDRAMQIRKMAD